MSKDLWYNSPKEDWGLHSPQTPQEYDFSFDNGAGFGTPGDIPNSPMLPGDLDFTPQDYPLQDSMLPIFDLPTPAKEAEDFVFPQPTFHPGHRRTPSMPVNIGALAPMGHPDLRYPDIRNQPPVMGPGPVPERPRQHRSSSLKSNHSRSISMPEDNFNVDDMFSSMCADTNIKINPAKLGFIPSKVWTNQDMTFGDIVSSFFQKKNNANSRFSHKLYNALKLTEHDNFYSLLLGVEWVSDSILKVDKKLFARLLGIRTIDGSFFHQQGNFPSHGFVELDPTSAQQQLPPGVLEGVDYDNVRLLVHQEGIFVRGCTESVLESCKWVSTKKRGAPA